MNKLLHTNSNTPTNSNEKLIVAQLVKKIPDLYGTQRSIAMFTKAFHWTLS
jgi:hypothetical protein